MLFEGVISAWENCHLVSVTVAAFTHVPLSTAMVTFPAVPVALLMQPTAVLYFIGLIAFTREGPFII